MEEVSRRSALRAGVAGLGASLAGCSGPMHLGVADFGTPVRDDEEHLTSFTFRRDGEDYLTLTVQRLEGYRPTVNQLPFRLSAWHREGTELDALEYFLYRADRAQQFSEFYLQTPGGRPWPEMTFERDSDARGVRLDVPDLGFQGSGTVSLNFVLEPDRTDGADEPFELGVDATFRLSETSPFGRDFRATVRQSVELPLTTEA